MTLQEEIERLFEGGNRFSTQEKGNQGRRVLYSSATYNEEHVVIVKLVGYSAKQVWLWLTKKEVNEALIKWTTAPGIFIVRRPNRKHLQAIDATHGSIAR